MMEDQEESQEHIPKSINQGIIDNDKTTIEEILNDDADINLNERDEDGRSSIDLAVILGRHEILEKLVHRCNSTILSNSSGYSPLHLCAIWGRLECLKILVNEGGADYQSKTRHDENVKDLALRYGNTNCVEFIECTEARAVLKELIVSVRETLTNTEKIAGKWNKDDKSKVTALCNEKTEWLDKNINAIPEETKNQTKIFEERYEQYLSKLS